MASYPDLRQNDTAPAPGGWLRAFPIAPLLGALAIALAVTVALRPEPVANPLPSFLAAHLGASAGGAGLVVRPTPGVRLEVDGAGYHAAGGSSRVSVTPESGVGGRGSGSGTAARGRPSTDTTPSRSGATQSRSS